MTRIKKIFLDESEMPKQWYNLSPDLPTPLNPPLGPGGIPVTLEMLAPVFPMNMLEQEVSMKRWFDIPEPETVAAKSADSCLRTGSCAGNTRKNLLQKRKCFAGRKPQTKYSGSASLVQ